MVVMLRAVLRVEMFALAMVVEVGEVLGLGGYASIFQVKSTEFKNNSAKLSRMSECGCN